MNSQTQNRSSYYGLRIAINVVLFLCLIGTAQTQDYFPIGAWCFDHDGTAEYYWDNQAGQWYLQQSEKTKLTNLSLTYFIACVSPKTGQALINYADDPGV